MSTHGRLWPVFTYPWLASLLPRHGDLTGHHLLGYIVKLAADFANADLPAKAVGEVTKITQAPKNAQMKLRRIRSGKGFLRPVKPPESEYTGVMLKREVSFGQTVAGPMIQPDQVQEKPGHSIDSYCEGVRESMKFEREAIRLEQEEAITPKISEELINEKILEQQGRAKPDREAKKQALFERPEVGAKLLLVKGGKE